MGIVKGRWTCLVAACAIAALALSAALPAVARADAGDPAKNSFAGITELLVGGVTDDYDVTGDGLADEIRVETVATKSYGSSSSASYGAGLAVYVNGSRALELGEERFDTASDGCTVSIVALENGAKYLYVESRWNNRLDATDCLYRYGAGGFTVAFDLLKTLDSSAGVLAGGTASRTYGFRSPRLQGVSGNSISFYGLFAQSMFGCGGFDFELAYGKGGLAVSPRSCKLDVAYAYGKKSLKARRAMTAYKSATGSKKAFTIKKGASVKVDRIYVKDKKVRVRAKVGKKAGWIKLVRCKGQMVTGHKATKPYATYYNKYFTNISVAG